MKALSLSQPWASAVAFDLKSIETRSWRTYHQGWLAIHASQAPGKGGEDALATLVNLKPSLFSAEHVRQFRHEPWQEDVDYAGIVCDLPLGAIVAVAMLYDCVPVEEVRDSISGWERTLGDYSDGRWAWLLYGIEAIDPVPCRGSLGLWTVPVEVAAQVERNLPHAVAIGIRLGLLDLERA